MKTKKKKGFPPLSSYSQYMENPPKKKLKRVSKTEFIEIKTPEDLENRFSIDEKQAAEIKRAQKGLHWVLAGTNKPYEEVEYGSVPPLPADSAWLLAQLHAYTTRMLETAGKKNADYAGASPEPFANFSHVESLGIATTEQGFLTRMTDKLCRVATFVKKGVLQVSDESVEDTLLDLSCYSLLMASYIKAKKAGML